MTRDCYQIITDKPALEKFIQNETVQTFAKSEIQ